jgi:mannitol 2-dehydrogenase
VTEAFGADGRQRGVPKLAAATLTRVDPTVATPRYDRSELTAGIVHIGVGGFHRAHMAMCLDDLHGQGLAREWGICGVGLLDSDRRMKKTLEAQDHLYTLTIKHPDGREQTRVIGSIIDYLLAPDDPEAVIERMAHPDTRVVSLTITEGGYNIDRLTGEFDDHTPEVAADLIDGATPTTVFGFVVEALARRRDRGLSPFTVLSCDNIEGNGHVAAKVFSTFADLKDPDLGAWIREVVSFPNSMVDRITPVTTVQDVLRVETRSKVRDEWPVVCEPYFQWVIEDAFPSGRPPFERAGAQLVDDVEPYELMKLRLLNASHQGLCYFGHLLGYRFVHDAMADPLIAGLLTRYMDREATHTLRPVPGIDLADYKRTLHERFANPYVRDTIARLCAESSDRIPKWLLPVIRAQLATGGDIDASAAIVASWARYAEAIDERGRPIDVVDPLREQLTAIARTQHDNPLAFIQNRDLFGDLAADPRFTAAYTRTLGDLHAHGARHALQTLVGHNDRPAAGQPSHPSKESKS